MYSYQTVNGSVKLLRTIQIYLTFTHLTQSTRGEPRMSHINFTISFLSLSLTVPILRSGSANKLPSTKQFAKSEKSFLIKTFCEKVCLLFFCSNLFQNERMFCLFGRIKAEIVSYKMIFNGNVFCSWSHFGGCSSGDTTVTKHSFRVDYWKQTKYETKPLKIKWRESFLCVVLFGNDRRTRLNTADRTKKMVTY